MDDPVPSDTLTSCHAVALNKWLSLFVIDARKQDVKGILRRLQKIYYSLQQQKVKSVKSKTTITELVVVWNLCSICTKSEVVTLKHSTLFAIAITRSRKISVSIRYSLD